MADFNYAHPSLSCLRFLTRFSFICLTLFGLLLFTDPILAFIAFITISLFYGLVYKLNLNLLNNIGKEVFKIIKSAIDNNNLLKCLDTEPRSDSFKRLT